MKIVRNVLEKVMKQIIIVKNVKVDICFYMNQIKKIIVLNVSIIILAKTQIISFVLKILNVQISIKNLFLKNKNVLIYANKTIFIN